MSTAALAELRSQLATIADLKSAAAVLRWDLETQMPPGGAEGRALQLATLARVAHELLTSDATRRLLDAADAVARGADPVISRPSGRISSRCFNSRGAKPTTSATRSIRTTRSWTATIPA